MEKLRQLLKLLHNDFHLWGGGGQPLQIAKESMEQQLIKVWKLPGKSVSYDSSGGTIARLA